MAVIGRPREYDRDQIARDLIEWAKKPDSINLNKFCALHDPIIPPSYITDWAKECDDFSAAYESAKLFLGFRREEKLNDETLHVKAYDLNAKTYDYFLNDQLKKESKQDLDNKKDIAAYTQKLASENAHHVSEDVLRRFEDFIGVFRPSSRNIAESNTKADDKS
jgi:hypothetical protein